MKYAYLILACKVYIYDATESKVWNAQHDAGEMWLSWPGLHRCMVSSPYPFEGGESA